MVQYAYIVIRGDGTVINNVKMLSVRSRDVDVPLRVTTLTVQQLTAGCSLRECHPTMLIGSCESARLSGGRSGMTQVTVSDL